MKRPFDCILGLREANRHSGVGLFNQQLADELGIPYRLLDDTALGQATHPLLSLKFEELDARQRAWLHRELGGGRDPRFSLFLHTLDESADEAAAVARAEHVLCGNDWIHARLQSRSTLRAPVRAFAPSLLRPAADPPAPGVVELFSFGMANKVDCLRFVRLRDLLADSGCDYRLLCSLCVHQTSDGSCVSRAVEFFRACFAARFVHLGTMSDEGVAYLLGGERAFVGFYPGGVRANNTTFNTALRFGGKIIANLDAYSPGELRGGQRILDLDSTDAVRLRAFLASDHGGRDATLSCRFDWRSLLDVIDAAARRSHPHEPTTSWRSAA